MKNLLIVDTNVLIYDSKCLFRFGNDNDILIPMGVIEELDKHKKGNDERGVASRRVVRAINEMIVKGNERHEDFSEGVSIFNEGEGTGKIFIRPNTDFGENVIRDSYVDNEILMIADALKSDRAVSSKYKRIAIVTKDIALRIKGKAMGLEMEDYENSKINTDSFYDKCQIVDFNSNPHTDPFWAKKSISSEVFLEHHDVELKENEYFVIRTSEHHQVSAKLQDSEIINVSDSKNLMKPAYGVIRARNTEQEFLLDALFDDSIKLLAVPGPAGTGKTLLSIAVAFEKTINKNIYERVVVLRPMVSVGKEMGFLPGNIDEKLQPWMSPIFDAIDILHPNQKKGSVDQLMMMNKLEFQAISLIRGRSIPKAFIIIDEAQNLTPHEIKTIVTRAGEGTKIILTGDVYQIDSPYLDERSNGMSHLIKNMSGERLFAYVNMIKTERSELAELASIKL